MGNVAENVSTGKPKITGGLYRAPYGTTLPTDATTALPEAYKCVGYISEDGMKNNNSPETEKIKAWGGDIVMTSVTEKEDKFQFKMIEALNEEVLKTVYGDDNVDGTLTTGITIHANSKDHEPNVYVFEIIMRGNALKRIVIPSGKIDEVAEINYKDNEPVAYDVTLLASSGGFQGSSDTHREHIIKQ